MVISFVSQSYQIAENLFGDVLQIGGDQEDITAVKLSWLVDLSRQESWVAQASLDLQVNY